MGKALMDSDALFKADIETMEKTLQALSPAPDWSLQSEETETVLIVPGSNTVLR